MVNLIPSANMCLIEPFRMGVNNIYSGVVTGKVTQLVENALGDQEEVITDLNLTERIIGIVVGALLLVPLINAVVLKILKYSESHYYQEWKSFIPSNEVLLQIEKIRQIGDLNAIKNAFLINPEITNLNIEPALRDLNDQHAPSELSNLYEWAMPEAERDWTPEKLEEVRRAYIREKNTINQLWDYYNPSPYESNLAPYQFAKRILSITYSYFNREISLAQGRPDRETCLKQQYRKFINAIKLAQMDLQCIDQSILELQRIVIDIVAFGYSFNQTFSPEQSLAHRAAAELALYKVDMIMAIFKERNIGDEEAEVALAFFKRNADLLGLPSNIFCAETKYTFGRSNEDDLQAVLNKFLEIYDPKKFFWDHCISTNGSFCTTFRNLVCNYASETLLASAEENTVHEINRALSANSETTIAFGADFKPEALTFLLQKANIISRKSSNSLLDFFRFCLFC